MENFLGAVWGAIKTGLSYIGSFLMWLFKVVIENPLTLIAGIVTVVVYFMINFIKNTAKTKEDLKKAGKEHKETVKQATETIKNIQKNQDDIKANIDEIEIKKTEPIKNIENIKNNTIESVNSHKNDTIKETDARIDAILKDSLKPSTKKPAETKTTSVKSTETTIDKIMNRTGKGKKSQ